MTSIDDNESKKMPLTVAVEPVRQFFDQRINVLPPESGSGAPLLMVIAAMCYLAALTISGVLSVSQAVGTWTSKLEQTVTVQVDPIVDPAATATQDHRVEKIVAMLETQSSVARVRAIPIEDARDMLEPWLGAGSIVDELPIPTLIEVDLATSDNKTLSDLYAQIEREFPGAKVDDHTRWNEQILVFADFLQAIAYSILALIIAATIAIIIFATRAGLAARHDIVEVLHLIGARDEYIAWEFQYQNLKLGLYASFIGMGAAFATLILLAALGGLVDPLTETNLLPPIEISLNSILSLLLVPIVAALVIATTTRITVMRVLGKTL